MDKPQIISFIQSHIADGTISREEVIAVLQGGSVVSGGAHTTSPNDAEQGSSKSLINVFYAIGAIIVFVGVSILVGQHWTEIGFAGRLLVTLGVTMATYVMAMIMRRPEQRVISEVLFVISAALAPLSALVLFQESMVEFIWPYTLVTAIALMVLYGFAWWISKRNILSLLTLFFASWAYYLFIANIFTISYDSNVLQWSAMLLGIAYLFIGYGFGHSSTETEPVLIKERSKISSIIIGFGSLFILSAGISIGGAFDLLYILVLFAGFYASVFLKSRTTLLLSALFMMAHIIKITYKYFASSVSWPVALIMIGFIMIGIGYGTYSINRDYISS